jgi:phosphonate transport system substrate-binding protein
MRIVLGLVALACIAVVAWFAFRGPSSLPLVDFGRATVSMPESAAPSRPEIRVAVAAMISPGTTQRYYEDILRLIGEKVGARTVFTQRRTYAEVNDMLESRQIDLAFVCSGPYVLGHAKFGMEMIAVPVVNGGKVYYSYILARTNAPYRSFSELKGRKFAFTDPDSNTGCLVPRFMLARMRQTPESFFGETFFTHSHDNSIRAVAEGLADGAAVDSLIWEFMNATDPTYTSRTRILEKSPPYGIPPVVVHPDMDARMKDRLKSALFSLHQDPQGVALLAQLKIERFDEGDDAMYASVREMQDWLTHAK